MLTAIIVIDVKNWHYGAITSFANSLRVNNHDQAQTVSTHKSSQPAISRQTYLFSKANVDNNLELSGNEALQQVRRNLWDSPYIFSPVLEESFIDPEHITASVLEVEESFIAPVHIAEEDLNDKLPGRDYVEKVSTHSC